MKKLTSILLALVLVFSFAACSNNSSNGESSTNSAPAVFAIVSATAFVLPVAE